MSFVGADLECSKQLESLLQCLAPESSGSVTVLPRDGDLQSAEEQFNSLRLFLLTVGASEECKAAASPFACQFLFPICDPGGGGGVIEPSRDQCQLVLGGVCRDAVETAHRLSLTDRLPDCTALPRSSPLGDNCTGWSLHDGACIVTCTL